MTLFPAVFWWSPNLHPYSQTLPWLTDLHLLSLTWHIHQDVNGELSLLLRPELTISFPTTFVVFCPCLDKQHYWPFRRPGHKPQWALQLFHSPPFLHPVSHHGVRWAQPPRSLCPLLPTPPPLPAFRTQRSALGPLPHAGFPVTFLWCPQETSLLSLQPDSHSRLSFL